jgi:hypothetical protein
VEPTPSARAFDCGLFGVTPVAVQGSASVYIVVMLSGSAAHAVLQSKHLIAACNAIDLDTIFSPCIERQSAL